MAPGATKVRLRPKVVSAEVIEGDLYVDWDFEPVQDDEPIEVEAFSEPHEELRPGDRVRVRSYPFYVIDGDPTYFHAHLVGEEGVVFAGPDRDGDLQISFAHTRESINHACLELVPEPEPIYPAYPAPGEDFPL